MELNHVTTRPAGGRARDRFPCSCRSLTRCPTRRVAGTEIAYETRLQALEARLKQAETQTADAASQAEPTAQAPARAHASFNPDISLILQGRYAKLDDIGERHLSGFMPAGHDHGAARGFSIDHTELVMTASIDPYFRGYFNLALVDEEVEIE